jgi:hypothetical protein
VDGLTSQVQHANHAAAVGYPAPIDVDYRNGSAASLPKEVFLFPFTFFLSEDASIVAFFVFAIMGWFLSKRRPFLIRVLSLAFVGAGLFGWCVLLVSGILGPSQRPWTAMHSVAGHLLLPIVTCVTALWLGVSVPTVTQHPFRFLLRLVVLMLLCACCFSNARTGYFGPSRVDPHIDPDNKIRFDFIHQIAFPLYTGLVLGFWFCRLVVGRVVELPGEIRGYNNPGGVAEQ